MDWIATFQMCKPRGDQIYTNKGLMDQFECCYSFKMRNVTARWTEVLVSPQLTRSHPDHPGKPEDRSEGSAMGAGAGCVNHLRKASEASDDESRSRLWPVLGASYQFPFFQPNHLPLISVTFKKYVYIDQVCRVLIFR